MQSASRCCRRLTTVLTTLSVQGQRGGVHVCGQLHGPGATLPQSGHELVRRHAAARLGTPRLHSVRWTAAAAGRLLLLSIHSAAALKVGWCCRSALCEFSSECSQPDVSAVCMFAGNAVRSHWPAGETSDAPTVQRHSRASSLCDGGGGGGEDGEYQPGNPDLWQGALPPTGNLVTALYEAKPTNRSNLIHILYRQRGLLHGAVVPRWRPRRQRQRRAVALRRQPRKVTLPSTITCVQAQQA